MNYITVRKVSCKLKEQFHIFKLKYMKVAIYELLFCQPNQSLEMIYVISDLVKKITKDDEQVIVVTT